MRGVFTAVSDTTEQVVGRRRLAALHEIGAQAGQARSVGEACTLVVRAIERAPQVLPDAAVYLRGPSGDAVLAASSAPDAAPAGRGDGAAAGRRAGLPAGVIVLAASAGRALDEAYASFLGLVAQQTAAPPEPGWRSFVSLRPYKGRN